MDTLGLLAVSEVSHPYTDAGAVPPFRFELHYYPGAISAPGLNISTEPVNMLPVDVQL